jgi:hypothetical protein
VGTEHLLLALLRNPSIEKALNVTHDDALAKIMALDSEALQAVGVPKEIDSPLLEERVLPSRPTVKTVMKHRIKLTPAAKKVLRDAGRPMRRREHITPEAVLLTLLEVRSPDPAAALLDALKIDSVKVRERLEAQPTT